MSFPDMRDALYGLEETIGFTLVSKTVLDHQLVETAKIPVPLRFEGILQPLTPGKLLVKPEGERKWNWWNLTTEFKLDLDGRIKDSDGVEYRVMNSNNWRNAGFYVYECIEGPTS